MSDPSAARSDWVARVLGVTVRRTGTGLATGPAHGTRAAELGFAEAQALESRGDPVSAAALRDRAASLQQEARRRQALGNWRAARSVALAALARLEDAMRESPAPERNAAILLVQAFGSQLTEAPATADAARALESFVRTDPILTAAEGPNVFGLSIDVRAPLLAALSGLTQALPDQGGPAHAER